MTPPHPVAAFFDLDRTLLTVNSGSTWVRSELRAGRIGAWHALEGALYLLAYKFFALDMERLFNRALVTVRGLDEETLRRRTREWFGREVVPRVAPGGLRQVAEHRQQGHQLVLLTSSSLYESEAAVEHFGFDGLLCTRYQVIDGRLTGQVVTPICFGPGKVLYAERHAAEHGIDLARSFFYTDSFTDLPMLERVGHPVAVHPDPRLRRIARRRGWPVVDWR
ncbi:MAG: HAD family hydrolase [Deltaproteobacteria bacterium]|nr:HAD family hydrolase [Deltaproteobacteria bacterium]